MLGTGVGGLLNILVGHGVLLIAARIHCYNVNVVGLLVQRSNWSGLLCVRHSAHHYISIQSVHWVHLLST